MQSRTDIRMKHVCHVYSVFSSKLPPGIFDQIASVSPESIDVIRGESHAFRGTFDIEGDQFKQITAILDRAGLRPASYTERIEYGKTYGAQYRRVYEDCDLEAAPAVQLQHNAYDNRIVDFEFPGGEAPIEMPRKLLRGSSVVDKLEFETMFAGGMARRMLCTDPVRRRLEAKGFRDVEFLEVKPFVTRSRKRHYISWEEAGSDAWWELGSDRRMPPLSDSMKLFSGGHPPPNRLRPTSPGLQAFWREEPPDGILPVELHYKRSDFEAMPEFDLAETCEGGEREHRGLICSPRFYRELASATGDFIFVPIRLDEE